MTVTDVLRDKHFFIDELLKSGAELHHTVNKALLRNRALSRNLSSKNLLSDFSPRDWVLVSRNDFLPGENFSLV